MAKRRKSAPKSVTVRTVTAKAPTPTIRIAAPAALARARTYGKRARRVGRRAHAVAGKFLGASQPQLTAIAGAAILGLLQKQGVKLPKLIDSLSTPANVGLIAFAAGKLFKNQTLDHMATGALSVAAWAYTGDAPIQGDVLGTAAVYGDEDYSYYEYPE